MLSKKIITPIVSIGTLSLLATACAVEAPDGSEENAEGRVKEVTLAISTELPESYVDDRGMRWNRIGPAPLTAEKEELKADGRAVVPVERTAEELALVLRPLRFSAGWEYEGESPDLELAKKIMADRAAGAQMDVEGLVVGDDTEEPKPRGINDGSDSRWYISNNTAASIRPVTFNETLCTGTMIGKGTLVTAAHCVYNTNNNSWIMVWDPTYGGSGAWRWPRHASGVDGRDASPWPAPGWQQCYDVTVPGGWVSESNQDNASAAEFDYAVVDFYSRCNEQPGLTTGYYGTSVASEGTIEGTTNYLFGYPSVALGVGRYSGSIPNLEAEIWGMSVSSGVVYIDSPSYQLKYATLDTSSGQSGAGVRLYVGSSIYLIGIHRGDAGSYNIGRRWDWTVRNFVDAYSDYPTH